MTLDKMIHYINNEHIVNAIQEANESQLKNWLKEMEQHIEIMGYSNINMPINLIAEKHLITYRLFTA